MIEGPPKEAAMRPLLLMFGICVCVISIGNRAEAQNYPWCAYYSGGGMGGGGCSVDPLNQKSSSCPHRGGCALCPGRSNAAQQANPGVRTLIAIPRAQAA